jgi:hypothetical protein
MSLMLWTVRPWLSNGVGKAAIARVRAWRVVSRIVVTSVSGGSARRQWTIRFGLRSG